MTTQNIEIGTRVFVEKMPASSYYTKVLGEVTAIKNGFATIRTASVKNKFADEWKAHECIVGANVANCAAQ